MKKEIEKADEKYSILFNQIYKGNYQMKKWLKGLGFKFDIPKPAGFDMPENFEFFYRLKGGV